MQAPETELKFAVPDRDLFYRSLDTLGMVLKTPRTFEANTLFDTPDRQLRARRQILRLRAYGGHFVVTHKRVTAPDAQDDRYKTRIETETDVEDPGAMAEIFSQLGFTPAFRYEKFRTEWDDPASGGHLVLDETPIGTWAELEGAPEWIDSMLSRLRVEQSACTVKSYGVLFLEWKERRSSPAENLTFDEIDAAGAENRTGAEEGRHQLAAVP